MKYNSAFPSRSEAANGDDWSDACRRVDEEDVQVTEASPLLSTKDKETPVDSLPKLQFSLVLLLRLAEPITATVILPFINEVCSLFIVVRCSLILTFSIIEARS